MSVIQKYMQWRDRKMNGPRRDAEAKAPAEGETDHEVAEAGKRQSANAAFGPRLALG